MGKPINENIKDVRIEDDNGDLRPVLEVAGDGPASPARRPSSNDGLGAAAPERN